METQRVKVGTKVFDSDTGFVARDERRTVEFDGKKVAETTWSRSLENSGTDKTLYRVEHDDGEFVVYAVSQSQWQGTDSEYKLKGPYTAKELSDAHPSLASSAGVEVPASLDEALEK